MKSKYLFVAAVATMALAACSSNDDLSGQSGDAEISASSDNSVQLSVVTSVPSVSKSVGSVGIDTVVTNNTGKTAEWNGEHYFVYMTNKGTLKPTVLTYVDLDGQVVNYENTEMVAPNRLNDNEQYPNITADNGRLLSNRYDGQVRYYPLQGQSDFWAYYIDDANTATASYNGNPAAPSSESHDAPKVVFYPSLKTYPADGDTYAAIDFKINGGQDLMIAATDKNADMGYKTEGKTLNVDEIYSAKAARANVQPTLVFDHKLVRLTFTGHTSLQSYSNEAKHISAEDSLCDREGKKLSLTFGTSGNYKQVIKCDSEFVKPTGDESSSKHWLSRGVYIDSIIVKSLSQGTMVFAVKSGAPLETGLQWGHYKGSAANYGSNAWATQKTDTVQMHLQQREASTATKKTRKLTDFTSKLVPWENSATKDPTHANNAIQLGEALLLAPADSYKYKIYFHQYKEHYSAAELALKRQTDPNFGQKYERIELVYPSYQAQQEAGVWAYDKPEPKSNYLIWTDLKTSDGSAFEAGKSYNIDLSVNGLEEIQITTTLTQWGNGGTKNEEIQ